MVGSHSKPLQRLFDAEQGRVGEPLALVDRAEEEDLAVGEVASREVEKLERRGVGPVEIVQHDQQRTPRG